MELHYFLIAYERGKRYGTQYKLVRAANDLEAGYKFEAWLNEKVKDPLNGFLYESVVWEVLETLT